MARRILLLFIALFACNYLSGQVLLKYSGTVLDAENKQPLINATLRLLPGNAGFVTDEEGNFELNIKPGNYTLEISYLGYEPLKKNLTLTQNIKETLYLTSKSVQVNQVTISSKKPDENIQSNKSGLVELDQKTIQQLPNLMGEPDIINALRLTPGVQGVGEGNPGLYVRGGDAGQNLILVDGMALYNPSHLLGFFPVFNADIINNVKIIKGAIPSNYGGKAASVIDIGLKPGNMQQFSGSGSIGILSGDLTLEMPLIKEKASLIVSGRRTYLDLVKSATEPFIKEADNLLSQTDYFFQDGSMKLVYRLSPKTQLQASTYASSDSYLLSDPEFNLTNKMQWYNQAAGLKISHAFSENFRSNYSGNYTRYRFDINALFDKYSFTLGSSIEDWNQYLDFVYAPSDKTNWRWGGQYIRHTLTPNKINVDVEQVYFENTNRYFSNEWATFLQGDFKLTDRFSFTAGLRQTLFQHVGPFTTYERDAFGKLTDSTVYASGEVVKNYLTLDPNFSMVYIVNKESSIKSSLSMVHQFIHLASVGTVSLPTDVWLPSTSFIKPQRVAQFTAGYFRNFFNNNLETSIEGYYKYLDNQVDFLNGVLDNFDNTRIEDNIIEGSGMAFGAELFIKKQVGQTTGWISYTLSKTIRKFDAINDGNYFPAKYDRVHDFSLTINHQLNEKWNISSAFIYATGNAMTLPAGRYVIQGNIANDYTDVNSFRMPAYHRLDISANYQFRKRGRFESWINFSVYNVYNHANPYYIYFRVKGNIEEYSLSVHPREISLFPILPSITWNFKF